MEEGEKKAKEVKNGGRNREAERENRRGEEEEKRKG